MSEPEKQSELLKNSTFGKMLLKYVEIHPDVYVTHKLSIRCPFCRMDLPWTFGKPLELDTSSPSK